MAPFLQVFVVFNIIPVVVGWGSQMETVPAQDLLIYEVNWSGDIPEAEHLAGNILCALKRQNICMNAKLHSLCP
jgi:hypothetical protein